MPLPDGAESAAAHQLSRRPQAQPSTGKKTGMTKGVAGLAALIEPSRPKPRKSTGAVRQTVPTVRPMNEELKALSVRALREAAA